VKISLYDLLMVVMVKCAIFVSSLPMMIRW